MDFNKQKKNLQYRPNSRDKRLNEFQKESQKTTYKFNSKISELENQLKSTNDILSKIKSLKITFDKINSMNLKIGEKMMKIKQINEYINKNSLLKKEIPKYKIVEKESIFIPHKEKEPLKNQKVYRFEVEGNIRPKNKIQNIDKIENLRNSKT